MSRCNYEGTLKDLLVYFRPKQVKRIYYQRLTIHEFPSRVKPGRLPRFMDVLLTDDLCDTCKPGDGLT